VIRAALIAADSGFRDTVRQVLSRPERKVALGLEVADSLPSLADQQVREIAAYNPELVILDFAEEPELGIRLVHLLADGNPARRFIAAGPSLPSELLLEAMRAGVSEYLPCPVTADVLREAVDRVVAKLSPVAAKPRQPGQLLAFFSAKGGSGATTVASNVAIQLHRCTGKRTLLVDLDLELGQVSLLLGVQPRFNFADMVQNFHRMDSELLASFIERHDSGVHLLSAPYHPEHVEAVTADQIRRILGFLRQHYDYVVVDTAKSLGPTTVAVLEQADLVFVVTLADLPSLRNVQRSLPLLRRVLIRGDAQIRLVLNRFQDTDMISAADVENTLGLKVYSRLGNDYEAVTGSINAGKPIVLNGKSRYAADVKALVAQIAGPAGVPGGRAKSNGRHFLSLGRLLRGESSGKASEAP
jgi:pilus assembly protein CpaE